MMEAAEKLEERARRAPRFRRAARTVAHLCGLVLRSKSYIGRSQVLQWAKFYLKMQKTFKNDLMFSISDYSKKQFKKGFEKLKHLLNICPKQRRQQDLLQIQACLKTNRSFQRLPTKAQLQLCQALVYQEYEAGTIVIKQGRVATECYLLLSGKIKIVMGDVDSRSKEFIPETICEAEEGDFIGETCLLTDVKRPASVICTSDAELLVIDKQVFKCILADLRHEQFLATSYFLRKLPIFSTWPPEKIDFLVHCSLQRFYRAGSTVVPDSLNSFFLVIVKSGRCVEVAKMDAAHDEDCSDHLNQISSKPFSKEKINFTGQPLEAMCKMTSKYKSGKREAQVTAETYCSSGVRKHVSDLEEKGLIIKDNDGIQRTYWTKKVPSLTCRFLKIRNLEQSDIFGLLEAMNKFCALQLSLISEGADCIFIPKKLFLEEAPSKSRQVALEMASSYPAESVIHESYIVQQEWSTYKTKLIGQYLERCHRKAPATINVCW
ncbi:cyclic nucleotide-binding domain-containing protein 2-like isoform X2 [Sphaerodactylus townsendi]|uniref:cyclic nucleotide-binding domain-containing protein 2-like isoform X2 n=1 Tax=Sphaerodactylus townsendi TaxID=933632 RepID=UPI002026F80D|nr:cyclic nucleotide-binding domain-containing protein 2-like isoform X2 [Sphaerodactylus townsendi]